jgi:hypothetical protein
MTTPYSYPNPSGMPQPYASSLGGGGGYNPYPQQQTAGGYQPPYPSFSTPEINNPPVSQVFSSFID